MRVALVDPSLFTLPYDRALLSGLVANDQSVTLYGREPRADEGDAVGANLVPSFYRISESRFARALPRVLQLGVKGVDHVASMLRLLRHLRRVRPDVIHFQWLALPVADRRLLAGFGRIAPLVLTMHDTNPFNGAPSSRVQGAGMIECLAAFNRLIVHTEQGRTRLQAQGVDPKRLVLLPHGLLEPLPAAPAADPFDGEITLLLFGKIKPYKGLDVLIEAFAQLRPELKAQARIRVVGKPYMNLAPIIERARALGIADRLLIEARFVPDSEVPAVFRPGTVVVFPYREIEASGVLSLALVHGRPAIASSLGSFAEELQDGVQGLLVPPENPRALAAALERVINDRVFTAACAREARRRAEATPSWLDIGRKTISVYHAMMAQAGARAT